MSQMILIEMHEESESVIEDTYLWLAAKKSCTAPSFPIWRVSAMLSRAEAAQTGGIWLRSPAQGTACYQIIAKAIPVAVYPEWAVFDEINNHVATVYIHVPPHGYSTKLGVLVCGTGYDLMQARQSLLELISIEPIYVYIYIIHNIW